MILGPLFAPLLLGHLLGDFPLQTNRVFQFKVSRPWGVLLHVSIVGVCLLVMACPYLHTGTAWLFMGLLILSHLIQDKAKLKAQKDETRNTIWSFLLDQMLHVFFIILVTVGMARLGAEPALGDAPPWLSQWYQDPRVFLMASCYVIGTYASYILIAYLKKMFSPGLAFTLAAPFFKYVGILERVVIATGVYIGGVYWLLIPLAVVPSLWLCRQKRLDYADLGWSAAIAVLIGLALKTV